MAASTRAKQALFDSVILIDWLRNHPQAATELARYDRHFISRITWMEVMAGATHENETQTRGFLDSFEVVEVNYEIAELAVLARRDHRLKLPDAIIWASSVWKGLLLITRNSKDFVAELPNVRVPYQLTL
jgi:predicted nucleic acid-binding protein